MVLDSKQSIENNGVVKTRLFSSKNKEYKYFIGIIDHAFVACYHYAEKDDSNKTSHS